MRKTFFASRTVYAFTLAVALLAAGGVVWSPRAASAQSGGMYCNCVEYARSRVPTLPRGMTTMAGKKAGINSYSPAVGAVAIIQVGGKYRDIGHVAVVTAVNPYNGRITIEEANYSACRFTRREGPQASLNIVGYYVPPRASGPVRRP